MPDDYPKLDPGRHSRTLGNHQIITDDGRLFDFARPEVHQVSIENIARALSRICRFGGHIRPDYDTYSVAEHSVRVAALCSPKNRLRGLLHDAAEAYIGDCVHPLKNHPWMEGYRQMEEEVETVICIKFGFDDIVLPDEVKRADQVLRLTEQRDVRTFQPVVRNTTGHQPLPDEIFPMPARHAERIFLAMYHDLTS